jgi:succinate dehydrogenase / fumarate reductase, iron-sulfur subunit
VAFDHDCREGICGMCGFMINGVAHGRSRHHASASSHAPFQGWRRAVPGAVARAAFPVVKDLVVDRSAFDRIIAAGGFISVATGSAPDGNAILVPRKMPTAPWTRPPASAAAPASPCAPTPRRRCSLGAKISHLGLLPQGQPERDARAVAMVAQANQELFGSCTNIGECEAVCPKGIKLEVIANEPRLSGAGVEESRFIQQPLQSRQGARRGIERGDERLPLRSVENEFPAVRERFIGTGQRTFENELAHGTLGRRRCRPQRHFRVQRDPQIQLLGSPGACRHGPIPSP